MALNLVTAPATEPVTLTEAKAHCRVSGTDEDTLITSYLLAARRHLEAETRRAFVTQTWDWTIDYRWPCIWDRHYQFHRPQITVPLAPLQSVTSISYVDEAGDTQVLATDQYRVTQLNNARAEGLIEPAYDVSWPTLREQTAAVTVRMVCGYGHASNPMPEELRQAMLLLIGHWYNVREAVNIGNIVNESPLSVASLVFPYRLIY